MEISRIQRRFLLEFRLLEAGFIGLLFWGQNAAIFGIILGFISFMAGIASNKSDPKMSNAKIVIYGTLLLLALVVFAGVLKGILGNPCGYGLYELAVVIICFKSGLTEIKE